MGSVVHAAIAAVGLAVLAALGGSVPAAADDYPYSGYFSSQPVATSPDDAQLACAFSFFRQNADGSFIGYHIDKPAFLAGGKPRYLEYGRGTCTISADKVETCTMSASPDEDEIDRAYYDVIGNVGADSIDSTSFDSERQASAFARRKIGQPALTSRFARCAGFSQASLAGAITDQMTTLSLEERGPLQSPEFNDANRALMRDILRALGTRK